MILKINVIKRISKISWRQTFINPLYPGVAYLYPLKTLENL